MPNTVAAKNLSVVSIEAAVLTVVPGMLYLYVGYEKPLHEILLKVLRLDVMLSMKHQTSRRYL